MYPGWHGGPTKSESYVPLIFAMPGDNFVDVEGDRLSGPPQGLVDGYGSAKMSPLVQSNLNDSGDEHLRNWHLAEFLRYIVMEYRDE